MVESAIERLAAGGDGIGSTPDGRVLFVPFTTPGDRVRVRVLRAASLRPPQPGRAARARPGESEAALLVLWSLWRLLLAAPGLSAAAEGQGRDPERLPGSDRWPGAAGAPGHDCFPPPVRLPKSHARPDDGGGRELPPPALAPTLRSGSLPGLGARPRPSAFPPVSQHSGWGSRVIPMGDRDCGSPHRSFAGKPRVRRAFREDLVRSVGSYGSIRPWRSA